MSLSIERTSVPTASLRGIDLSELPETADLQTRKDRKYLLSHLETALLLDSMDPDTRVLQIGNRRSFGYESLYFDTPRLDCYHAAAHRRPNRFKVRSRLYLDSGLCRLEVKTRDRRRHTVKHAMRSAQVDHGRLTTAGLHFVADVDQAQPACRSLVPSLTTRYRRTTLLPADGTGRVTIDTDLRWIAPDGRTVELGGLVVVETKSAGSPTSVDRLLWRQGHRPLKVSKYAIGMVLLHPELPANKWHPALARIRAAAV